MGVRVMYLYFATDPGGPVDKGDAKSLHMWLTEYTTGCVLQLLKSDMHAYLSALFLVIGTCTRDN